MFLRRLRTKRTKKVRHRVLALTKAGVSVQGVCRAFRLPELQVLGWRREGTDICRDDTENQRFHELSEADKLRRENARLEKNMLALARNMRARIWVLKDWKGEQYLEPRAGGTAERYVGQTFDPEVYRLAEETGDHRHCILCYNHCICSCGGPKCRPRGYTDGLGWLCMECHNRVVVQGRAPASWSPWAEIGNTNPKNALQRQTRAYISEETANQLEAAEATAKT